METPTPSLFSAQCRRVEDGVDGDVDPVQASKQRRRMQNRKNQRTHRLRAKGNGITCSQSLRPFKVERWRLDELDGMEASAVTTITAYNLRQPSQDTGALSASGSVPTADLREHEHQAPSRQQVPLTQPSVVFPLSTDHLLHLIHYNVFRAFVSNKRTLNVLLTGWTEKPSSPNTCPIGGPYRDDTMVYPLNPNIPTALVPTHLQQTRLHSLWINFIPFPRVRDNLIRREGSFDHWELLQDLIGELMSFTPSREQRKTSYSFTVSDPKPKSALSHVLEQDGDEITAGRNGLIVWGEPHDMRSWEATPQFLRKWAWAVKGCTELIDCSNRWRRLRGEEDLHLHTPTLNYVHQCEQGSAEDPYQIAPENRL